MTLGEFDLIQAYFAPLAGKEGLGLKDDAAIITPSPGYDLVVTKDLMVEGVHFLGTDPLDGVAFKALMTNLSDLAAKGAEPLYYFLGLSASDRLQSEHFAEIAAGLRDAQDHSGIRLAGGDTTRSSNGLTLSITAIGRVPAQQAILRAGASDGEDIWVTGHIGLAAVGLKNRIQSIVFNDNILLAAHARLDRPVARTTFALAVRAFATAGIDVSDGLIADLGHLCRASGVAAVLNKRDVPIFPGVAPYLKAQPGLWEEMVTGGDDYELLFTAAPRHQDDILTRADKAGLLVSCIGRTTSPKAGQSRVTVMDEEGHVVHLSKAGYQHF